MAIAGVACAESPATDLQADHQAWVQAGQAYRDRIGQGRVSDDEAADYAAYLGELRERVARGCATVMAAGEAVPAGVSCPQSTATAASMPTDPASVATRDEQRAVLDAELGAALGELDELLLREQDRIRATRPLSDPSAESGGGQGASGGAQASAGGSQGQGEGEGQAQGQGQGQGQVESGEAQGRASAGGQSASAGGLPGTMAGGGEGRQGAEGQAGAGPAGPQGSGSTRPADLPDPSGDDVVARQLREAAELERDPELKVRLWDEYRRYRKGIN